MCNHSTTIVDHLNDAFVCTTCGLVLRDRPSLYVSSAPTRADTSLPSATRECVSTMGRMLRLTATELYRAAILVRDNEYTARHPAALAACVMHAKDDTPTLREVEQTLQIRHKALSRAVSRLKLKQRLG